MRQATGEVEDVVQANGRSSQAYRRLMVWQKADELAYRVYQVTKDFPDDERFGLISQMRRASISVAANIVEGYAHSTRRERYRFYEIARASLTELEYYLDFTSKRLGYIKEGQVDALSSLRQEVGRLLFGLLRS